MGVEPDEDEYASDDELTAQVWGDDLGEAASWPERLPQQHGGPKS